MSETREDREKRWATEYAAHVAESQAKGEEPINYQNWSYGKKLEENGR